MITLPNQYALHVIDWYLYHATREWGTYHRTQDNWIKARQRDADREEYEQGDHYA